MKDATVLTLTAIICITVLESIALMQGINGAYFAAVVAAVGAMGGFELGRRIRASPTAAAK